MPHGLIKDLRPGEQVVDFFVLRKKELRLRRETNESYLALELGDQSGRIAATLWDNAEALCADLSVGQVIKVKGVVVEYAGRPHLKLEKVRPARADEVEGMEAFVPVCPKDLGELWMRLDQLVEGITNPHLKGLLQALFGDSAFRQVFAQAPAGKLWHHNYRGGLLEHTVAVAETCAAVHHRYSHLDRDLLVTGALLHDVGKVQELKVDGFIDYSDQGRLIGHIVLGAEMVREKLRTLPNFPEELAMRLLHLILSHQGKGEYGSPVVPMTLEAIILYYADELDSKANAFERIIGRDKEQGKKWSRYVELMDRFLYLGEEREPGDEQRA
ncbi:MAG: HD domain-containing protein [candidate division KSB1 bacterium]|nr:HD domain-containing protein [candidate division KSB1 bacterium]MDZ7294599.1 HD domain-containing protein [candidate division KSB1 bacterium]MDZ7385037.1 HD domain-containing protein [candidate division KSB1 bacterium]MDZ7393356.1 HD domain-containing protein [candidate division KSB1 bacterium]